MIKFCEKFNDDVTGYYYYGYHLPRERMVDFLKMVKEKPGADLCWLTEDVERDMQNVSGTYSLDDLINEFDSLVSDASDMGDVYMWISLPRGCSVFLYPRDKDANLYTQSKGDYVLLETLMDIEVE